MRNALEHGLCARKYLLLPGDSRARLEALEAGLLDDLARKARSRPCSPIA